MAAKHVIKVVGAKSLSTPRRYKRAFIILIENCIFLGTQKRASNI